MAAYLGVPFGQLLYAGDSLGGEEWDMRGFAGLHDVRGRVLHLALAACAGMA